MWKVSGDIHYLHRGKLTIHLFYSDDGWIVRCDDVGLYKQLKHSSLDVAKQSAIQLVRLKLVELTANANWMVRNG